MPYLNSKLMKDIQYLYSVYTLKKVYEYEFVY